VVHGVAVVVADAEAFDTEDVGHRDVHVDGSDFLTVDCENPGAWSSLAVAEVGFAGDLEAVLDGDVTFRQRLVRHDAEHLVSLVAVGEARDGCG
jgi:hypothetical protein